MAVTHLFLFEILRDINAEQSPSEATSDTEIDDDEPKPLVVKPPPLVVEIEPVTVIPRIHEDPNKKLHDERLAESHRRMLDELAVLDQRRKVPRLILRSIVNLRLIQEEEERYAHVLQEQQVLLAEEYGRLQVRRIFCSLLNSDTSHSVGNIERE